MRFWQKYEIAQTRKQTPLCIGLDTVFEHLPLHLQARSLCEGIVEFNKGIIDATHEVTTAYKINLAFYEQYGVEGWKAFEKTLGEIPSDCITIADAKRGDIGNTSKSYAKAFFERYNCDAITVAPYMGQDSVAPFLEYTDQMTFVLALTSNAGSHDFQRLNVGNKPLYKTVVQTSLAWAAGANNCGFVVGATHPQELTELRAMIPETMLLIPGIGAQGGDITATIQANYVSTAQGKKQAPALINVSRGIVYASKNEDFAQAAFTAATRFNDEIRKAVMTT
jgi:orotidine-5'-phosphate decarboxylase